MGGADVIKVEPRRGDSSFIKGAPQRSLVLFLPCEHTVRRQPSMKQEVDPYHRRTLDLALPASRTVKDKCLLFESPSQ